MSMVVDTVKGVTVMPYRYQYFELVPNHTWFYRMCYYTVGINIVSCMFLILDGTCVNELTVHIPYFSSQIFK